MRPFDPLFRNRHLQTIAGSFWPRTFDRRRFAVTATWYQTEPGVKVLVHSQCPAGEVRGTLILVHGLEGSSEGGYMLSAAQYALERGFQVHRVNIRTCGGTEDLCHTLYHAGLTSDLRYLVETLAAESGPVFLAGFSLGANQCVKLAGELGDDGPRVLAGVIGVSTPVDLKACAVALKRPSNYLYQERFLRNMVARLERRCRTRSDLFRTYLEAARTARTVYDFDDRVTARFFGFGSAEGYYGSQSSGLFLDRIRVPLLLIQAKDDPMIPFSAFSGVTRNPMVQLHATDHGGHVGFLARSRPRLWLDAAITEWILEITRQGGNKSRAAFVL